MCQYFLQVGQWSYFNDFLIFDTVSSFHGNYAQLNIIRCLATMQKNWFANEYMEMLSGAKKVFTFLREIFVREAGGKKASKVVDDSRGKFWWIGRGSFPELWIPASVASPIPLPPTSHTLHLWQWPVNKQILTFSFSGIFSSSFLGKKTSKAWTYILKV